MNPITRALARVAAVAALVAATVAQAAYPERPITFIVPWGAGGGTDTTARYFAAMIEKELGQPVNVVNRTGGSGVVGHSAIAQAPELVRPLDRLRRRCHTARQAPGRVRRPSRRR